MPRSPLAAWLGLGVSGDLGELTFYTDRYRRVIGFLKSPPHMPPSPLQVHQRERFAASVAAWRDLSQDQKDDYERCSKRLAICMTGHNLWMTCRMNEDRNLWLTIQRQSGITLAPPIAGW